MNLGNFRVLARAVVPGAKTNVVTTTVVDLILNAGVLDIAGHTACLKANKKFTITADVNEYNLSSVVDDYLVADKPGLWWNAGTAASPNWLQLNPRTLKWLDDNRPDWRDEGSDDPIDYSIDGDVLTLVPTPDTTLANGLWLYYGKVPTAMSSAGNYSFTGSAVHYTFLDVFDKAILAYWEWEAQKTLNKGQDPYRTKEKAYKEIREEKFTLFKRRFDISAHKDTKMQGKKFRS